MDGIPKTKIGFVIYFSFNPNAVIINLAKLRLLCFGNNNIPDKIDCFELRGKAHPFWGQT